MLYRKWSDSSSFMELILFTGGFDETNVIKGNYANHRFTNHLVGMEAKAVSMSLCDPTIPLQHRQRRQLRFPRRLYVVGHLRRQHAVPVKLELWNLRLIFQTAVFQMTASASVHPKLWSSRTRSIKQFQAD